MQGLFPEGHFFTVVLTALAEARLPDPDVGALRADLALLDSPELTEAFGSGMVPEHGIFHAGWTLLLATEVARVSGEAADRREVALRSEVVAAALRSDPSGFPQSYPGQRWPCDAVVAAAALARADGVGARDGLRDEALPVWWIRARQNVDGSTGLLPHRVRADGTAIQGPRGSSQSIIQTFWPDVAPALARVGSGTAVPDPWSAYVGAFLVREAGLVGVREWRVGFEGDGDVDSGPLVLGVSASASAVTLAAARRNGDRALADSLDREAELLGLGLTLGGERRYALGQVPVGDASLLWARTVDPGEDRPSEAPQPRWWLLAGLALLPGVLAVGGLVALRRRTRPHAPAGSP